MKAQIKTAKTAMITFRAPDNGVNQMLQIANASAATIQRTESNT